MDIETFRGRRWVLLPGTLCTGAIFDGILDALGVPRERRSVVEMRHPDVEGFADDLRRAVRPGAVVCGFSLGAIVAAHHADRLDASLMLLFGLNPHGNDPAKADERRDLARDVARRGGSAAMAGRLPPLNGPDPDGARALILRMAEEAGDDVEAQTALALSRPGALASLRTAKAPIVAVTGTLDRHAPLALAREAVAAAPDARLVPLEGLGHYALAEDPGACARALVAARIARHA